MARRWPCKGMKLGTHSRFCVLPQTALRTTRGAEMDWSEVVWTGLDEKSYGGESGGRGGMEWKWEWDWYIQRC